MPAWRMRILLLMIPLLLASEAAPEDPAGTAEEPAQPEPAPEEPEPAGEKDKEE